VVKFKFVLNLSTAKALGVEVLLARAGLSLLKSPQD
jgi:hypothetical protein